MQIILISRAYIISLGFDCNTYALYTMTNAI
jgi:hypothetical protein